MIPRPYNSWTTRDLEMCRRRVVAGDPAVPVELPWKLELLQSYWYEWGRYYYETPTTSFFGPGQLLGQFAEVEQGDRRFVACIYPYNLSKSRNI